MYRTSKSITSVTRPNTSEENQFGPSDRSSLTEDSRDSTSDFLAYSDQELDRYRRRDQIGTWKNYRSVLRKFRAYLREVHGVVVLPWYRLTVPLIREFETYCAEVRGNGRNTIYVAIGVLQTFLRKAIKDGYFEEGENPFPKIDRSRKKTQRRNRLNFEQVICIRDVDLEHELRHHVRQWFLFAFFAGGMRFSDVATLRNDEVRREGDQWYLDYEIAKTGTKMGNILPRPAAQILTSYYDPSEGPDALVFNVLEGYDRSTPEAQWMAIKSRNTVANRHLKAIQQKAGIEVDLTFHLARHSLADHLRQDGWSIYDISKLLGHADIKTTERYLAGFDRDGLNEKLSSLFSTE